MLLEENFKQNIKSVIGTDCPYFGKMLYLYLGGGFDKARINIGTWINFFSLFYYDDDKIMQQKLSFKLLDIDRDG